MTTTPVVTYEDLAALRELRDDLDRKGALPTGTALPLLDRLIAAAEADQPPLPEGWVLLTHHDGSSLRVLWHHDGDLYLNDDRTQMFTTDPAPFRDRLTPLRPTVTEADIENATAAALSDLEMLGVHPEGGLFQTAKGTIRAAFKAAGIEVTP